MLHDMNCDWLKYKPSEGTVCNKQLKALLRPILPDIRNCASSACPSNKNCIKMKMYLEQWWNDTAKWIKKYAEKILPSCHFIHQSGFSPTAIIFTTDLTWSGPGWNADLRGEGGRGYWPLQLRHTHKTTFIFSRVLPSAIHTEEETFVRVSTDLWTTVDSSDPK
jgi:hypothetical protein